MIEDDEDTQIEEVNVVTLLPQACDVCNEPLKDDEGQRTADAIVCERCCKRLIERSRLPSIGYVRLL